MLSLYFVFNYLHLLCAICLVPLLTYSFFIAAVFHGNMINFHKLVERETKSASGVGRVNKREDKYVRRGG